MRFWRRATSEQPDHLSLSLVVCTYKRPSAVEDLLCSLDKQVCPPDEIIVVDASPDNATKSVVESHIADRARGVSLRYYKCPPQHTGLTRQRNYGIERAKSSIIAFLDDDTLPDARYFAEIRSCFMRHGEAAGVGGYITNEISWQRTKQPGKKRKSSALSVYRWGDWERREDYRWRLRRMLRLADSTPPGWMPASGHGRSTSALPPDGADYPVEYLMGGASAWRRYVLDQFRFSPFFEGYGLYEDMDFCLRVSRIHPLFLCTAARLEHHHVSSGRPSPFRYGTMVVRNGWYVWRQRWPQPHSADRARWWAITLILALCRAADSLRHSNRQQPLAESLGRIWGMLTVLIRRPTYTGDSDGSQ